MNFFSGLRPFLWCCLVLGFMTAVVIVMGSPTLNAERTPELSVGQLVQVIAVLPGDPEPILKVTVNGDSQTIQVPLAEVQNGTYVPIYPKQGDTYIVVSRDFFTQPALNNGGNGFVIRRV